MYNIICSGWIGAADRFKSCYFASFLVAQGFDFQTLIDNDYFIPVVFKLGVEKPIGAGRRNESEEAWYNEVLPMKIKLSPH